MRSPDFDAWVSRAREADILSAAQARGAVLKRQGREWVGPCPSCGGTDRFAVSPDKGIFNCRGAIGGDVIALLCHAQGMTFVQACEALTGEPPPGHHSSSLSDDQRRRLEAQRKEAERVRRQRQAEESRREAIRSHTAGTIWRSGAQIAGTHAEAYLLARGIPLPPQGWPDTLRFVASLPYDRERSFPALIGWVQDVDGKGTGVWRIYLGEKPGKKAPIQPNKLGLGKARGGAVRFGGVGPVVCIAEGIETALAVWALNGFARPVWAALSTAGMAAVQLPPEVRTVEIYPDGDPGIRRKGESYEPAFPQGLKAALALKDRMVAEGRYVILNPVPKSGSDYLDALKAMRELETA